MRNDTKAYFGSMDWTCREWGFNAAKDHATLADIEALIAANFVPVRFTAKQKEELVNAAEYAYMMRLKHQSVMEPQAK